MIYSAKQMPSEAAAGEGPMAPGMLEMALKVPAFERVPREQDIPMSIAQERLWLASQFDDSAARYSITVAVRLQSEPDEGALRESARAWLPGMTRCALSSSSRMDWPVRLSGPTRNTSFPGTISAICRC
jgi:hypothetical protein